jgi:hypothetical protein
VENDILKKYIAVDLEFAFSRIIDNLEGNDNVYINKENYNLDDKTLLRKGMDKLQTKYSDNLEKSNEKLLKLEKEVVNIEKHKNEREKEMEV